MDDLKHFSISTKEDALVFLNFMITLAYKRLHRYKNYLLDVEKILSENRNEYLKESVYDGLAERMEALNLFFVNLYGDDTKGTISYLHFRNMLKKKCKNGTVDFSLPELNDKIKRLLIEFQDRRNWAHHIPQSQFTMEMEYVKKNESISDELIRETHSGEIVYVMEYEFCNRNRLGLLYESSQSFYKEFQKVLQNMKGDYSYLLGKSMRVITQYSKEPKGMEMVEVAVKSYEVNSRKRKR